MNSLGEELEQVPGDPEGRWGFNHAIDMGAYGGTTQGSLSPTKGTAPGVGAVDLRDYWPFTIENEWWTNYIKNHDKWQLVQIWQPVEANGFEAYSVLINNTTSKNWMDWVYYCVFVNDGLYMTQDPNALGLLPQITEPLQLGYPKFLTVGATILVPDDPFAKGSVTSRSVTILRGSLEQVHEGVAYDPTRYLSGLWPDVIAFRLQNADGTLGEPIALFARGFGPLMLNGQAVDQARVDDVKYGESLR